ncbi:MAG: dTDP-4-dehydrorhamnose 3,5-epimerase family protein [Planctomycetes bacterium]|nr:dTDP-4-dehydrorhamnose 3,5-epimerase family protein [Planctomycetota bacterium]
MKFIDGVRTKQLRVIPDERGYLMEMLRCDDEMFVRFGQVYLTVAFPGVVKGWHYHNRQDDIFVVVKGMIKLVLYDQRGDSSTCKFINELFIGERNPMLVTIPAGVVHGFKGIGVEPAYLINLPTEPYDYSNPDEFRISPRDPSIPYDWALKEG